MASTTSYQTPSVLMERSYERIEENMRTRSLLEDSDFIVLGKELAEHPSGDMSLSRQLKSALDCEKTPTQPEAYLFTTHSAIPVADAFRGNFAERGQTLPQLGYIAANRYMARYSHGMDNLSLSATSALKQEKETEIERLQLLYQGLKHVCVVEQYVNTGSTLMYALHLLEQAGIDHVSAIRGRWYLDAEKDDVDVSRLTSAHANFMHKAGAKSCL